MIHGSPWPRLTSGAQKLQAVKSSSRRDQDAITGTFLVDLWFNVLHCSMGQSARCLFMLISCWDRRCGWDGWNIVAKTCVTRRLLCSSRMRWIIDSALKWCCASLCSVACFIILLATVSRFHSVLSQCNVTSRLMAPEASADVRWCF